MGASNESKLGVLKSQNILHQALTLNKFNEKTFGSWKVLNYLVRWNLLIKGGGSFLKY